LFYWLIDVACINGYRLYQLHTTAQPRLTHLKFRAQLYYKLLGHSEKAKLQHLRVGLGGRKVFGPELQHLHYWEKRVKQETCARCLYESRCKKVLREQDIRKKRVKRSMGGCVFCAVAM
jgi:hypothetical protein